MEKRRYARAKFSHIILLYNNESEIIAEIVDFSLKGAFVKVRHGKIINIGEKFSYAIVLSNNEDIIIKGDATVVRSDGESGYGLTCDTVNMDYFIHLKRLLDLNTNGNCIENNIVENNYD